MGKRDNQNRDLDAAKAHEEMLAKMHLEGVARSHEIFEQTVAKFPLPDWVMFDNVLVLRAGKSRFVGVPRNGRKTSATFDVLDIVAREPITILHKNEVYTWLWKASQSDDEEAITAAGRP